VEGLLPAVLRVLLRQFGVISRAQALAAGMSSAQITRWVSAGRWLRVHRGVYRAADVRRSPEGDLLAACLATAGYASHESAAALWDLVDRHPRRPVVTIEARLRTVPSAAMVVHHRTVSATVGRLLGIPCTKLSTTVFDLAGALPDTALDDAVDRALAKRALGVLDLLREADHPANRGRRGRRALLRSLDGRGYLGGPAPSVLESKVLRLLLQAGIRPLAREAVVTWAGGHYRLDLLLVEGLALEVDGYAYHAHPEGMTRDLRRRRHLQAMGIEVLAFTWLDVVHDGPAVVDEVRAALARRTSRRGPCELEPPRSSGSHAPAALPEAVPDRPDGRDEVGVLLAELGPQPPDVDVDGPGAAVVLVPPHPAEQGLPGEHPARVGGEELEQLVLHVGEVEGAAGDHRLVGLQVEHQRPVLHQLGAGAPARPPEQVGEAGLELTGRQGHQAEVVEEVLPQLQVGQLADADDEQQGLEWQVTLAQLPAQGEGALRVPVGADHRSGPPVRRLRTLGRLGGGARRPRVPAALERLDHGGRRRVGEDEQWIHGPFSGQSERR
jgi:hypothetical protein